MLLRSTTHNTLSPTLRSSCHGIGVIHADLKPENIMLRNYILQQNRGDAQVKLIDFGCSEVQSHPEEHSGHRLPSRKLTHADGATTAYCPPEAFDDDNIDIDQSADMWALGGEFLLDVAVA